MFLDILVPLNGLEIWRAYLFFFLRACMTLEDNITMDFQKWDKGMASINLSQDMDKRRALVNEVMNLQVP